MIRQRSNFAVLFKSPEPREKVNRFHCFVIYSVFQLAELSTIRFRNFDSGFILFVDAFVCGQVPVLSSVYNFQTKTGEV